MNVLQLLPRLNVGGVEKGTVEVAKYLTLKGHKAIVVSEGGPLEKNLAAIGARHYRLPVGRKNPFIMIYCYFRLKHLMRKENIDIVHGRSRVPALTGYFASRADHRTFITTAHGQYKKHLISRVMGWGKTVIAANNTMARHMKENFNVPYHKIEIIPRGVDLDRFYFRAPEKRENKFRIGMICRFTPLKGHLDFLKAASYVLRRIPNLEIVLMGDRGTAKEEYLARIDLNIRRMMLEKVVVFKDSGEDVPEVMRSLDVVVSANRQQEAFGRTVIEAQSSGVPVVATRIGGVVENIEEEETGLLCEPADPPDMSEKILRYYRDRDLYRRVAYNARRYVEEKYSLEKTMAMTLETYRKTLTRKKILIFKISALGDIILSIPSLRAVRRKFANATIKVLTDVRFRDVLDNCPYIDEVVSCDLGGRDRRAGLLKLAHRLRSEDFDISIDLQNNRKSHLLAFLSAIYERYGYDNHKWSCLINRKISLPAVDMDPVDHQGVVLGLLGITNIDKELQLWTTDKSDDRVEKILRSNWLKPGQKLVAFSVSASEKWRTKNWPLSNMADLADMLAREKGIRVVLAGAESDRRRASELIRMTGAKPIDLTGKTDMIEMVSVIKRCDALVTGDSAPMHVAAACGTPFVALFGPTSPERHLPPDGPDKRVIRKRLRCSPCYSSSCLRKARCMRSISPGEVFDALLEIIDDPTVSGSQLKRSVI
ncbi:MAG: lipopolysaccharide heptosyltransferase II [Candidatus Omnitrophica bacterium]|nr:lipopolysaccharide heptosyltransferase II [Candidatus Omnitrophota bacterium]